MKDAPFQPGPAAAVSAHRDGVRWTLVFVRQLRHPRDRVWRALTEPAQLREWAPYDAQHDLGRAGDNVLTTAGSDPPEATAVKVVRAEPPALLQHTWGDDLLRWELAPTPTGTRLTLRHTMKDRLWLPKVSAGWHVCVAVLDRALAGDPVGRTVGGAARERGWERLNDEYARLLGVENTGWPEGHGAGLRDQKR